MGDLSGRFCRLIRRDCGIVGFEPLENLCDLSGTLSRSEERHFCIKSESVCEFMWCTSKQKLETCLGVSHMITRVFACSQKLKTIFICHPVKKKLPLKKIFIQYKKMTRVETKSKKVCRYPDLLKWIFHHLNGPIHNIYKSNHLIFQRRYYKKVFPPISKSPSCDSLPDLQMNIIKVQRTECQKYLKSENQKNWSFFRGKKLPVIWKYVFSSITQVFCPL